MTIAELISDMRREIDDNEALAQMHYLAIGRGAFDKLPHEEHSLHMKQCGDGRKRIAELKRTIAIIKEFAEVTE